MEDNTKICTNIFKSEISSDLKKNFTQKWVEIINNLEKEKIVNFHKQ